MKSPLKIIDDPVTPGIVFQENKMDGYTYDPEFQSYVRDIDINVNRPRQEMMEETSKSFLFKFKDKKMAEENNELESTFGQRLQSNAAIAGMASGFGGIIQGLVGRGDRRAAQIEAQDEYDDMLSDYKNLDTSNLYANVQNKYANLENTMEDLTINQQQAQFQAQQGAQSRANIMQGLRGAAGSSGIAGLAQAMANQGQLQNQQASASIGMQESRNQMASAQMAAKIQQMERGGEAQAEAMRLAGAEKSRSLEYQQTGTMLGMSQQRLASANNAIARADAALYGGIGSLVGVGASAALGGIGGS